MTEEGDDRHGALLFLSPPLFPSTQSTPKNIHNIGIFSLGIISSPLLALCGCRWEDGTEPLNDPVSVHPRAGAAVVIAVPHGDP